MIKIITDLEGGFFWLQFAYNLKLINVVKTIDGRKWHKDFKMWYLPATPAQASIIDRTLKPYQYTGDETFYSMLAQHNQGLDVLNAAPVYRETSTDCWNHQLIGLDMGINRNAIYLAWEMGTGKSKTVVDLAGVLKLHRILILCPSKVVAVWPRQFIKHGQGYGIRCVALKKKSVTFRRKVAEKALSIGPAAIVINYEASWMKSFSTWALSQCWDLVVCDEAHRIKGHKSNVTKFAHKLSERATRRVCMSGTPIPNNPLDLWAQCKFLDAGLFGNSFMAFKARYCVMGGFQEKQVLGFRNLDDMNRRFYEIAHRVTKEEALDLPEQLDITREIELGSAGVRHYSAMESAFVAQVDEGTITIANVLVESLRLQQCTGGATKYDGDDDVTEIDTEKQDLAADIISDLPMSEPVVIFCRFRHDLTAVHNLAAKLGRRSFELSGKRDEWEQWQYQETDGSIIAVQIQAGGLGIDLTRACYGMYYSLGASLGDYDQSRSRLHREGQKRPVTYYHLLALNNGKKTVDHKTYKALSRKENVAESVLTIGKP